MERMTLTHNGRIIADDIYYCRSNNGKLEITALVNRYEDKFYDDVEDFNDLSIKYRENYEE